MYLYACRNNGRCRQIMFEQMGIPWLDCYVTHGIKNFWDGPRYKCCTDCKAPVDQKEAIRINKVLGNSLEDEKFDDEFLELLNALE